jgi:hypothetical protein
MAGWLLRWLSAFRVRQRRRRDLLLECIILRHQIAILQRTGTRRPCFRSSDRLLWVLLSRWWANWQRGLIIVQPATVLRWRRRGLCAIWASGSCGRWRGGRPRTKSEICALILRMNRENFLWGAPRIHGELLKLGFDVSQASVSRYMPRRSYPPSQSWRTFLRNQILAIGTIDLPVADRISAHLRALVGLSPHNCIEPIVGRPTEIGFGPIEPQPTSPVCWPPHVSDRTYLRRPACRQPVAQGRREYLMRKQSSPYCARASPAPQPPTHYELRATGPQCLPNLLLGGADYAARTAVAVSLTATRGRQSELTHLGQGLLCYPNARIKL